MLLTCACRRFGDATLGGDGTISVRDQEMANGMSAVAGLGVRPRLSSCPNVPTLALVELEFAATDVYEQCANFEHYASFALTIRS